MATTPRALFQQAVESYQRGDREAAERQCRAVLEQQPEDVNALNVLAVLRFEADAREEAAELMRRVVAAQPGNSEAWYNLGKMLNGLADFDAAATAYERAIALNPSDVQSLSNLGTLHAHADRHAAALELFDRALAVAPGEAKIHYNRAEALHSLDRLDEAEAGYREALRLDSNHALSMNNLATIRTHRGAFDESIVLLKRAVEVDPTLMSAHSNLSNTLREQGRAHEAVMVARNALEIDPDNAIVYVALGLALRVQGKLKVAADCFRAAMAKREDFPEAIGNLADVLMQMGRFEEGIPYFRRSLELNPRDVSVFSNYLFALNYVDGNTRETVYAEHRRYHEILAVPEAARQMPPHVSPDPDRPLTVGYVSGDFRTHSVAYFFEPMLDNHDRSQFRVILYGNSTQVDETTTRLRDKADQWVDVRVLTNDRMAARVRDDAVDILVDLSGHTGDNRMRVFARRPAPVQVTWLGYPNTTGLDAIDYRLSDAETDPPGDSDRFSSETLFRLEGGFHCFRPNARAPEVSPVIAAEPGAVTFGSFNNPTKLSPRCVAAWSRILHAAPRSRLLLKGRGLSDPESRAYFFALFKSHGIDVDRLEFIEYVDETKSHLALYGRVDIALDPFPYTGTTTTCEALWMGVPVVSLEGDRHAGRVGASLLRRVGHGELVQPDEDSYLRCAVELSQDIDRLRAYRTGLRPALKASPLCDEVGFALKVEDAYRRMWRDWCATRGTDP